MAGAEVSGGIGCEAILDGEILPCCVSVSVGSLGEVSSAVRLTVPMVRADGVDEPVDVYVDDGVRDAEAEFDDL